MTRGGPIVAEGRWGARRIALVLGGVVVAALTLLVSTEGARRAAERARPRPISVASPVPGTREDPTPVITWVWIDESGSTGSSDPTGARITDTRAFAAMLARSDDNSGAEDNSGAGDKLAIGHFADRTSASRPLSPASEMGAIDAALAGGHDVGGGTNVLAAVQAGSAQCAEHPESHNIAILVTDGQAGNLNEVETVMASSPCRWGLVALSADRLFSSSGAQERWAEMPLTVGLWRADAPGHGSFAGPLVAALTAQTGQDAPSGGWLQAAP